MTFAEILASPFVLEIIVKALVVGTLVSLCAALLGVPLVLKRYSMIGDGLSHIGFGIAGIAAALGVSTEMSLEFSIPFVIVAAVLLLKISENSKIKGDAAIAMMSTGAVAIGVIAYDKTTGMTADICNSLFGSASIITISEKDLILSILLSVLVLAMFIILYNRIFMMTFDENFGKATGIKTGLCKLMISLFTAITIVLGMKLMGALMISAVIIFPALTAMRLCKSFKSVTICAAVVSVVCYWIGFAAATRLSLQTGPCVIIANLVCFGAFALMGKLKEGK